MAREFDPEPLFATEQHEATGDKSRIVFSVSSSTHPPAYWLLADDCGMPGADL